MNKRILHGRDILPLQGRSGDKYFPSHWCTHLPKKCAANRGRQRPQEAGSTGDVTCSFALFLGRNSPDLTVRKSQILSSFRPGATPVDLRLRVCSFKEPLFSAVARTFLCDRCGQICCCAFSLGRYCPNFPLTVISVCSPRITVEKSGPPWRSW